MAGRPHVTINVAQSLNGMIAGRGGRPVSISCKADIIRVDRIRQSVDAILVGANTIINDNPFLTLKSDRQRGPKRIILDRRMRVPWGSNVFDGSVETIIFTSVSERKPDNARTIVKPDQWLTPENILSEIWSLGVKKLLIEGGQTVIEEILNAGLCDEFFVYQGNVIISDGLPLFRSLRDIKDTVLEKTIIGNGVLYRMDCKKFVGELNGK
ncbi:MAG: RibD family protein [Thermoplasmataceae archaeon]